MPNSSQINSAMPIVENLINCKKFTGLATLLTTVKKEHPNYFYQLEPPFEVENTRLLIVGLAQGKHGTNTTGRAFISSYQCRKNNTSTKRLTEAMLHRVFDDNIATLISK